MRRAALIVAALLACRAPSETESRAEPAKTHAAEPARDAAEPARDAEARSSRPRVALPAVSLLAADPAPSGRVVVSIGQRALWLSRPSGEPVELMPLDAIAASDELLEPLAERLLQLAEEPEQEPRWVSAHRALVVRADARTRVGVLRRVLTTARAVDYRSISYVTENGSLELSMGAPVVEPEPVAETPLLVRVDADGSLQLDRKPLDRDRLLARVERQLEYREGKYVFVEAPEEMDYADWLDVVGRLAGVDAKAVTIPSPAVPADRALLAPPPAPPPAYGEPEAVAVAVTVTTAKAHPSTARVEHWWGRVEALEAERARERCDTALAFARDAFAAEATSENLGRLAAREDDCGDPEKAMQLRRRRTETFADDPRAWRDRGIGLLLHLMPSGSSSLLYNDALPEAQRRAMATEAIEALDKALALDPAELDIHSWAAIGHGQRANASLSEAHARVDRMSAWRHTNTTCMAEGNSRCGEPAIPPCCPAPPLTEVELAAAKAAVDAFVKRD